MDNHLPEREREKERKCAVKKNFQWESTCKLSKIYKRILV